MRRKRTHEEYIQELDILNKPFECLGRFEKVNQKVLHKCKICGYKWSVTPNRILNENINSCPQCSYRTRRLSEEEYLESIKDLPIILLDPYTKARDKLRHKCEICQTEWKATPASIRYNINKGRGHGCPHCANNTRWSPERYRNFLSSLKTNIRCKEDYVNNHTPLLHHCNTCGHTWKITPASLKTGRGCPICQKQRTKKEVYSNRPTTFYYIFIPEKNIWKVGITMTSVGDRYRREDFYVEPILEIMYENGYEAWQHEQRILNNPKLRDHKYLSSDFIGWSEAFTKDIRKLINIEERINE